MKPPSNPQLLELNKWLADTITGLENFEDLLGDFGRGYLGALKAVWHATNDIQRTGKTIKKAESYKNK